MLIPKPYQKLTVDASALIARSEGQFIKGDKVFVEYQGEWREATVQKTVKQAAGTAFEVKILKPYKVTLLPAYKIRFRKDKTTITTTTTVSGGSKTVTTTVVKSGAPVGKAVAPPPAYPPAPPVAAAVVASSVPVAVTSPPSYAAATYPAPATAAYPPPVVVAAATPVAALELKKGSACQVYTPVVLIHTYIHVKRPQ